MRAATLFSGIGAPECAAPDIDWCWSAEIDPFAAAVHAARFPGMPNLGDVNRIDPDAVEPVDLVVFGSPCQSFSIAGKRLGLDDPRGNLALVALRLVERLRPRWFVFENVPGLLSSDGGRDFGAFLGTVEQCGYGWAYRTLDAQFAGVPQRRRRVFVVGCLGDWRAAAAVLFEPESLRGDTPPRREAGQRIARPVASSPEGGSGYRNDADTADNLIAFSAKDHGGDAGETAPTLRAGQHHKSHANAGVMPAVAMCLNAHAGRIDGESETFVLRSDAPRSGVAKTPSADAEGRVRLRDPGFNVMTNAAPTIDGGAAHIVAYDVTGTGPGVRNGARQTDIHTSLRARAPGHSEGSTTTVIATTVRSRDGARGVDSDCTDTLIAHSLRADGFDASEDGTGRGTPLTLAIRGRGDSHDLEYRQDGTANAILTPNGGRAGIGVGAVAAYGISSDAVDRSGEGDGSAAERAGLGIVFDGAPAIRSRHNNSVATGMSVRRLTPRECERLQGFPDDFTAITYRGKPAADGPRYRALGNSMAVPVIGWVLGRIREVAA